MEESLCFRGNGRLGSSSSKVLETSMLLLLSRLLPARPQSSSTTTGASLGAEQRTGGHCGHSGAPGQMNPLLLRCEGQYFFQKEHGSHNTHTHKNNRILGTGLSPKSRGLTGGTSLTFQWLRLCASTAGSTSSIPGWGTKILLPHGPKKPRKFLELNLKNENTKYQLIKII